MYIYIYAYIHIYIFTTYFFSTMMMVTRNKTTKNTCNSAPTTMYCAVGEKPNFIMLNSNNN